MNKGKEKIFRNIVHLKKNYPKDNSSIFELIRSTTCLRTIGMLLSAYYYTPSNLRRSIIKIHIYNLSYYFGVLKNNVQRIVYLDKYTKPLFTKQAYLRCLFNLKHSNKTNKMSLCLSMHFQKYADDAGDAVRFNHIMKR